jgi:hypothetical protein
VRAGKDSSSKEECMSRGDKERERTFGGMHVEKTRENQYFFPSGIMAWHEGGQTT